MSRQNCTMWSQIGHVTFYLCLLSTTVRGRGWQVPSTDWRLANADWQQANASKALTMDNLNPNIIKLEFSVAGPVVTRAKEIEKELEKGAEKPFKRIIWVNSGNPQGLGQKPITFLRQVISSVVAPELIEKSDFPEDVKKRATDILDALEGRSAGAYTASNGVELIRRHVAEYIERRDGHPSNWQDIILANGATPNIKRILELFRNTVNGKPSGVMVPKPQYPLYSATLEQFNLTQVSYTLDEDQNWGLDPEELERAIRDARDSAVRAIVVINPGNPTGQVLTQENIESVIRFAHRHHLLILADEVYQYNIYAEGSRFYSFKKVLKDMGEPYASSVELVSVMTISKGYMGECGLRGGWMELVNMDPEVQNNLSKFVTTTMCPNSLGQVAVDVVVKPPVEGDPSYQQWYSEKTAVLESLKQRAKMVVDAFNNMEGFHINDVQGALYAFPSFSLSAKALQAAKEKSQEPDLFYALQLLEETGICVTPGSGFGQRPGTYHFRTTILPQPALLQEMLDIFQQFHKNFTARYSD